MRIAFHNPWLNSSENQAYMSMAEAGRRIGVELIACANETDIEACRPDFVLAVACSVAKITDFPTYLTVHEPTDFYLSQPPLFRNLFSFDGYLTISDSLARFIKDICAGTGRIEEPGFCYLTPQVSDLVCDWDRPDRAETLRVAYFGTNWSRRMPLLFRALDPMGILRIHGPEESWALENLVSYQGPSAFDGVGPQRVYAECGIGLALLDDRWQREDVISNRIFEISSVGAVSICPDMPWTRQWFGDSVLYFDASRPMREIAEKVRQHTEFCRANPAVAGAMGREARRIFETHFCAERLLANAVDYHRRKSREHARRVAAMAPEQVSVIVRCGGRDIDFVRRAVDSIRRQTFGSVTVILAKYRDTDLGSITGTVGGAITAFDEFLIEGGDRAVMLWAGLNRVATPYFAILDDDDFWLSDHLETLFHAGRRVAPDFDIAFSGVVHFDAPVPYNYGRQFSTRNIERFGFPAKISDAWQIAAAISTGNFVARRDLLTEEMLVCPAGMRSAEDSVLIGFVARRGKPVFSWRPTAFYRPHAADGSNWQQDAQRQTDEMRYALRTGLMWSPRWLNDPSFEMTNLVWWAARHRPGSAVMGEQMDRLVAGQAGEKTPRGIRTWPGIRGFVAEGPKARLEPGRYVAVFLITPSKPEDRMPPPTGDEPAGAAEVVVLAPAGAYFGHRIFDGDDAELVLRFAVDAEAAEAPIDLRVFAYGNTAFTLASVGLHRDVDEAPGDSGATGQGGRVTQPVWRNAAHAASAGAEVEALRAEIDAIRRSTSWRVTAPLRRLATAALSVMRVAGGRSVPRPGTAKRRKPPAIR